VARRIASVNVPLSLIKLMLDINCLYFELSLSPLKIFIIGFTKAGIAIFGLFLRTLSAYSEYI
jgi:hypothetical protein